MLKLYIGISLFYYSEVMMLVSTSEIQYRSHTLTYLNGPILCINHLPSHTAALYYHGDKNALGLAIMMICDVSSQQFQFEALLVPEQIGNTEWRVGMRTGGGKGEGPDPDLSPAAGCYGDRWFLLHHDGAHGI